MNSDIQRILALPVHDPAADELQTLAEKWTARFRKPGGTWTIQPHQALALEYASQHGALLPMTVGSGKTLVGALLPAAAGIRGADTVLLCPPVLVQEAEREYVTYAKHFDFDPPTLVPYTALSKTDATDLMDQLAPEFVIADEAHALKDPKSARTRRFLRYMTGRRKEGSPVRFVAMSATFSSCGIREFAHLALLALEEGSPLPAQYPALISWAKLLDAKNRDFPGPSDYTGFEPMLGAWSVEGLEKQAHKVRAQAAFGARLRATPGVVVTDGDSYSGPVYQGTWSAELSPDLEAIIEDVTTSAILPNGHVVTDPLPKRLQLAHGFYYYLDWNAIGLDEPDLEWLYARAAYRSAVEELRKKGRRGLDSWALIERAIDAGDKRIPADLLITKRVWDAQRHKPEPPRAVEWIDDSPLQQAVEFSRQFDNCLVWSSFGAVHDRLELLGLPVARPGERPNEATSHVGVATWSHSVGLNLQRWNTNLILDPPVSAGLWQQLLGRTARYGQQADAVHVYVGQTLPEQGHKFAAAIDRAHYIERTQQLRQRLCHLT